MGRKADLFLVTALAITSAAPAHGADRHTISIAPGRLGEATIALARQTRTSIGMSDQSLAGIRTPAVTGNLSVEAALKRLLKGSGATARRIDGATWRIIRTRPAPPVSAPAPIPAAPADDQPEA
ncbi:MAG: STN domain-containing protein, partial [Alphaproteobacteria bacterium]